MRPWKDAEKRTSTEEEFHVPTPNSVLSSVLFNAAQSGLGLQKHYQRSDDSDWYFKAQSIFPLESVL
jgi:hypothetical protein